MSLGKSYSLLNKIINNSVKSFLWDMRCKSSLVERVLRTHASLFVVLGYYMLQSYISALLSNILLQTISKQFHSAFLWGRTAHSSVAFLASSTLHQQREKQRKIALNSGSCLSARFSCSLFSKDAVRSVWLSLSSHRSPWLLLKFGLSPLPRLFVLRCILTLQLCRGPKRSSR